MQKITNTDPLSQSAEIVAYNIQYLKALFPVAFTEGKIDFEVLKQLLGGAIDEREEKYGLNWHGKRKARQLALTPSVGTLRPCPDDSVDWDTTRNLIIEGDNLEVLKLLQKSYAGKVKLIYIDPPYNTGKDFVYPDNFQDNIKNYLELTGQTGDGGAKLSSNTEASGRFHTLWLNMMYPRLKLARNLLQDDGVICVSIADDEGHHLRVLLNDVFGEENFIATCVWQKRYSRENRGIIGDVHDYLMFFARNIEAYAKVRNLLPLTDESAAVYKNPNNDPKGRWRSIPMTAQGTRPNQMYKITTPGGAEHSPPAGRCWSTIESEYLKLRAAGRIWFGADGKGQPNIIRYLTEVEGLVPWTWWPHEEVGHTDESKKEVNSLFDGVQVFDTPKPVRLLRRVLDLGTNSKSTDVVLDFFAGSGTTGHAVFEANAIDGGNRRYIMVQLPEPVHPDVKEQKDAAEFCDKLGKPRNLAELAKERLRRAGKEVQKDNGAFAGDLGFRVFRLDASNIQTWDPDRENLEQSLLNSIDHIKPDRSEEDVLYELLLKLGLDLCVPIEQRQIAGKTVHSIGAGVLLVCLAEDISRDDVEALAHGMIDWHKELAPSGETTIVFRDSGFQHKKKSDDVAKTNITEILKQHGLQNIRSL
jgi:adenine-specific DNA-methyltransferase